MKVTAKMSVIIAAIFAVVCFSVAITGFVNFLGTIGVVFGALGIWIHKEEEA